jgi:integrase
VGTRKTEGSVYQLQSGPHAGKWVGDLVTGWRPDGRPIRTTRRRATKTAAAAALREMLNQRDRGQLKTSAADWTVAEWLPHWIDVLRADDPKLGPSTRDDYHSLIRTWITPHIGGVRLDLLQARQALKVQKAMRDAGRSGSRRHHVHVMLRAALDAAVRQGILGFNPLAGVEAPSVPHRQIEPLERGDVEAIYHAVMGSRLESRWLVALILGLRQGEALGLEWRHVDLDAGTVRVQQQLRRARGRHGCGEPTPAPTKTSPDRKVWPCGHRWASKCPDGKPGQLAITPVKTERGNRTVPLTPDLVHLLTALRSEQDRERLVLGDAYRVWSVTPTGERRKRKIDLVFRRADGGPYEPSADSRAWHEVLDKAAVDSTRLHNARHAAAVGLLDSGVPLALLGRLLGHASDAFSMQVYGSFSREAADAARDLMQAHHAKMRTGSKASVTPIRSSSKI